MTRFRSLRMGSRRGWTFPTWDHGSGANRYTPYPLVCSPHPNPTPTFSKDSYRIRPACASVTSLRQCHLQRAVSPNPDPLELGLTYASWWVYSQTPERQGLHTASAVTRNRSGPGAARGSQQLGAEQAEAHPWDSGSGAVSSASP